MRRTTTCSLIAAGGCLLASCESETYVSTRITGRVTGLWDGATLEVGVRTDSFEWSTRVNGSDVQPGPPASDAVDFVLGLDGAPDEPYQLVFEEVAPGFTCTAIRGGSGTVGAAAPIEITCTPPVGQVALSAAPGWRFDPGAVVQTAPVPTLTGATTVAVSGWSLTRVMIDGVDTAVGAPSREHFLGLGRNAVTLELHAGYARRSFELSIERGGLAAPAAQRLAPVPDAYNELGRAIAADGDRVAVASYDRVYVFRVADGAWLAEASIDAAYPSGLALAGDTLAFGTVTADGGAVEIHRAGDAGWRLDQRLAGAAYQADGSFGRAIAIFADTMVVGAPQATVPRSPPAGGTVLGGAAYTFRRGEGGWALETKLVAPNPGSFDNFGASVAISFNVVAIGAPYEDACGGGVHDGPPDSEDCEDSGAVHTFIRLGSWDRQSYIKAASTWNGATFGAAVAYSGELLVVGAPGEPAPDRPGEVPGGLHVLRSRDPLAAVPWQAEAHLESQIPDAGLGLRVAVRDGLVAASSRAEAGEPSGAGAVQLFAAGDGGWQPRGLVKTERPSEGEGLGRAVAVAPHAVLASAVGHDGPGDGLRDVGAVYELRLVVP
jgi:hypothetical protein